MADNTTTVKPEDTISVGTRISWGAVLAGAVVALALYLVLTTLGAAVGLSISRDISYKTLAGGALVWVILSTALSLFAGGWTTSQLTAGETKCESMIHGLILWGVIVAAMMWMTTAGIRSGFSAMLSVASASTMTVENEGGWEPLARGLGWSDAKIERVKDAIKQNVENAEDKATDDRTLKEVRGSVAMITWGTLFTMLLSMGASIAGALAGSGPERRLLWAGRPPLQRTTVPADRQFANVQEVSIALGLEVEAPEAPRG